MSQTNAQTDAPQPNELWILLNEGENDSRFAIARVLGEAEDEERDERGYRVRLLYDRIDAVETPLTMSFVSEDYFYAPLPDHDEWGSKFEDLLDEMLGLITAKDVAGVLNGETPYQTNGERGYEAARFFVLDGIAESITEWSVHQGHGASRYGRAVESRLEDLPEWMQDAVLFYEKERWDSGFSLNEKAASCIVEILLLREKHLDEDHEDEIRNLVQVYDLEYDDYKEVA